jgi:hypothetical protein
MHITLTMVTSYARTFDPDDKLYTIMNKSMPEQRYEQKLCAQIMKKIYVE